ncbi:MFS transporter [Lactococcus paracarnosus]|uniref:MFS transporter n=1 Tax=Pseudolactococcus paracarnosus TaxID=2749962 RepID=A0A7L4WF92_9LACT|nr:MFS transporter [Lactococcus paracarnosus]SPC37124.1 Multidrug resistance protein 2 [Lactococcus piscium]MCJ1978086.1 MFS transporter [Lactococcus paracarnosus]MCJ1984229.1 MFS transporter [Lactococcus paracarnosus]MCJ1994662.1 MFS transporter [Lactococcus paracarnosus]MCJ1997958.1 MFS transporter [Lactococcus paracarnosus]
MKSKKSMMYLAISNLFLVFLGVGLVIPVIPQLKDEMNFSGTTMGMMISIFAITQLLMSPVAGILSDKMGRKKIIATGMIIFSISELLFGLAQSKNGFYVSRGLGGIAAALIMPAVTAYVADMTTIAERPKAMGIVSAAISGGFIIGPGVGGIIAYLGIRAPFYAASLLSLIGFILTLMVLKEPEKNIQKVSESVKGSILATLKRPIFASLFAIILISSFGLQAFEAIYSIMASSNFSFTTGEIAMIITVSGIIALICQVFFFDAIVQKIGEIRLIQLTFFASGVFIAIIAFTKSHLVVVLATFVVFLAFDLFRPAVTTYLSKHAGNQQGMINGLNSTFTSFGNILGPLAAGYLFDLNHIFPYYISAIILLGTGVLSLFLNTNHKPATMN